jgi:hypothetical protein
MLGPVLAALLEVFAKENNVGMPGPFGSALRQLKTWAGYSVGRRV